MNKNYQKGRRIEYKFKKILEEEGFHTIRASGSHGDFDLVSIKRNTLGFLVMKFTQLKSGIKDFEAIKILENIKEKYNLKQPIFVNHEYRNKNFKVVYVSIVFSAPEKVQIIFEVAYKIANKKHIKG